MEELLEPAEAIGINVIHFMAFIEHFKKTLNIQEYQFWRGAGSSYFESDI